MHRAGTLQQQQTHAMTWEMGKLCAHWNTAGAADTPSGILKEQQTHAMLWQMGICRSSRHMPWGMGKLCVHWTTAGAADTCHAMADGQTVCQLEYCRGSRHMPCHGRWENCAPTGILQEQQTHAMPWEMGKLRTRWNTTGAADTCHDMGDGQTAHPLEYCRSSRHMSVPWVVGNCAPAGILQEQQTHAMTCTQIQSVELACSLHKSHP